MLRWRSYVRQHNCVPVKAHSNKERVINEQSIVRVLVVEDFADWRGYIAEKLREIRYLTVIHFATDGLAAVRQAAELKPDLILMDIGLPSLNGIAAGRQIRKLVPDSKIIFVTAETSASVAEEALSLGAAGYVLKTAVDCDLLDAVEAVMSGKRFVSQNLSD
jgi:two-component system, NarL family, response regulator NreC